MLLQFISGSQFAAIFIVGLFVCLGAIAVGVLLLMVRRS